MVALNFGIYHITVWLCGFVVYSEYPQSLHMLHKGIYMYVCLRTDWRRFGVKDVETLRIEGHGHSFVRVVEKMNCLERPLNLTSEHHRSERGMNETTNALTTPN